MFQLEDGDVVLMLQLDDVDFVNVRCAENRSDSFVGSEDNEQCN